MRYRYHFSAEQALAPKAPAELGLEFTHIRRLELPADTGVAATPKQLETGTQETALVCLAGSASFTAVLPGGRRETGGLSARDMLFLPPGTTAELSKDGPVGSPVIMACSAPSELGADFGLLRFTEIDRNPGSHKIYGKPESGSQRDVWNYVDAGFRCSRLMLGICEGRAGGWTAWPPHEHAAEREEVYVYFDMAGTFGVQCIYEELSDPIALCAVREGDVVSIPRGYHPNVGSPAGRICYVYCMTAKVPGERNFMDLRVDREFGEKFE